MRVKHAFEKFGKLPEQLSEEEEFALHTYIGAMEAEPEVIKRLNKGKG